MKPSENRTGLSSVRLSRLSHQLANYVERGEIAGAVALVYRNNTLAHSDVIGWQDEAAHEPMRADTLFRIASMSKPITSVAALILLEDGALRLDDPIERWLPEFADPRVLRHQEGPLDDTVPAERSITICDLLTHRPGFVSHFFARGPIADAANEFATHPLLLNPAMNPDTWLKRLAALPLVFQPGSTINYGWATDVLGLLIGRITQMGFAQFLRKRLFEPLGMVDTGFHVPPEKQERLSVGYGMAGGRRVVTDHPTASLWGSPPLSPSGSAGLVSTAGDFLQFSTMLLNGGTANGARILSRKSIELMTSDFLTPAQRAQPFHGSIDFWAGQGFGLGVSVVDRLGGQSELGSPGQYSWGGAYGTWWFNDPQEKLSAVLMIQLYEAYLHSRIRQDFENLVYQAIDD